LIEEADKLVIIYSSPLEQKLLRVAFVEPRAYRRSDESDLIRTFGGVGAARSAAIIGYVVSGGDLKKWLELESCGVWDFQELQSFLFLANNFCVEVVSFDPPNIELIHQSEV
jgi:hypothetical protein